MLSVKNFPQKNHFSLGPDVGCYAPPKLYEKELQESLQAPGFENWSYTVENVDGALQVQEKTRDNNI